MTAAEYAVMLNGRDAEAEEERIREALLQAQIAHLKLLVNAGIDVVKSCEAIFGPNAIRRSHAKKS